ncbi:MAG TPA: hypothetical protein VF189_03290 [Patescibacteria group bacterium]
MKEFINKLKRDNVAWYSTLMSCIIIFFVLVGIGILYQQLPPYLPLYNHLPWGYERLGHTYEIFIPIAFGTLLILGNIIIGLYLLKKNPLLGRFLFFTNAAISFFVLIFVMRIFQVIL